MSCNYKSLIEPISHKGLKLWLDIGSRLSLGGALLSAPLVIAAERLERNITR
jgi:hypothetical protein